MAAWRVKEAAYSRGKEEEYGVRWRSIQVELYRLLTDANGRRSQSAESIRIAVNADAR